MKRRIVAMCIALALTSNGLVVNASEMEGSTENYEAEIEDEANEQQEEQSLKEAVLEEASAEEEPAKETVPGEEDGETGLAKEVVPEEADGEEEPAKEAVLEGDGKSELLEEKPAEETDRKTESTENDLTEEADRKAELLEEGASEEKEDIEALTGEKQEEGWRSKEIRSNGAAGSAQSITVKNGKELQDALKNARNSATSSRRYIIHLASGVYNLASPLTIYSHVTINTEKNTVLTIAGDITINGEDVQLNLSGSTIKYTGTASKYAIYMKGAKKVSITGGVIEGGGIYANAATHVSIQNVTIRNYKENGIYAKDSSIEKIEAVSCYGGIGGVFLKESSASAITGCTMQDFSDSGIKLTGKGATVTDLNENQIISVSKLNQTRTNGIYVNENAKATNVKGNSVTTCYIGIYIVRNAQVGTISNNTVKGAGEHGVYLSTNATVTGSISNNTIQSFQRSAIQLYEGCTVKGKITGNKIEDGKGTAILITGPTNKKAGSVVGNIEKNEIRRCTGDGIGIYHASHCGAISKNTLDTIGGNHDGNEGDYGIIIDSMMKADTYCSKISDNDIRNVTYAAIAIYSGPSASRSKIYQDTAFVKGNIENNTVVNSGTYKASKDWKEEIARGGKKGCLSGIYVDTHARVKGDICNNKVATTGEHGIYIHLLSYVRSIYNNDVSDTKEAGIEIYDSTVLKDIYNNTVTNAGTNGIAGGNKGIVKGKIRNNKIVSAKECGIYLDLSNFKTIQNNEILGIKKHGIYIADKSTANNILSNQISMQNAKDGCGIKITENSKVAKITKNKITGKMTYGVRSGAALCNMEISSNTMTTSNSPHELYNPILASKGGKYTYTIKGNKITGNKTNYGIRVVQGKAQITGNTVAKTTYPIYISVSNYKVTIKENKLSGNANNEVKTASQKIRTSPIKLKSVKNLNGKKAKVTWQKRSDISDYIVYQSVKSGKSFKKVKDVRNASVTVTGLNKGTTYYYKICGYQKDGKITVYTDMSAERKVKISK